MFLKISLILAVYTSKDETSADISQSLSFGKCEQTNSPISEKWKIK